MKSDQGPDILNLLKAVKRERKEDIQIMPEESPVGEHQSNGEVERVNQTLQGQFRSMKLALESRYSKPIRSDHSIFPWLVIYAGILINICKVGPDGRTPYERRKGKRFNQTLPELGECIWYLKPQSAGVNKLDPRWEDGIYAGLRIESGEIYVMSESGVIKVKHYKQRPESERWNLEELDKGIGVPWEPIPGRAGIQVKSHFTIIGGGGEEIVKMPETRAVQIRRIYIGSKDLEKYGNTIGCKGCEAQK